MKISLEEGNKEAWVFPNNRSIPIHKASADELANHWFYQGTMYTRYKYSLDRVYKVGG